MEPADQMAAGGAWEIAIVMRLSNLSQWLGEQKELTKELNMIYFPTKRGS